MTILHTQRLRLEPLNDSHFDGLYAINRRPEVMRYITGQPDTPEQTTAMIERTKAQWALCGYSWWAYIDIDSGALVGTGCVQNIERNPLNPLELGWRLHPDHWGQGYATEAARTMMRFAFAALDAQLLCAVCHQENADSAAVMERLGMRFISIEHWYQRDLAVYGISREKWLAVQAAAGSAAPTTPRV
ncbi:GNAT family N-acetyltransferase [Rugamonas sp.]|uniref:GNAT family N-acetyltransferase n=1 Tax=Rugamonas sp. TaxID=1926287 RepID=UPI0025DEE89F|nr:GNAT family N-acetyltransferase [Rugamonas sp.]